MIHYSDQLANILHFIRQTQRDYHGAVEAQKQADMESQDLLHRLELCDDGHHETARLGKLLRQVRRDRRAAKDTQELTELIDHWASENKAAVKSLERVLGEVRHREERQQNRGYLPRTDILEEKEA